MNTIIRPVIYVFIMGVTLIVIVSVIGDICRGAETITNPALDTDEVATLTFIREEEKLARDVYLAMESIWQLRIFTQISESEQEHMDAIKRMLDKYDLPDPALGMALGEFKNQEIQLLYFGLTTAGSMSRLNSLQAGAFIEEYDIADLSLAIDETDNSDLQKVYGHLKEGSKRHLRAFVTEIEKFGVTYKAQWLPPMILEEILQEISQPNGLE